MSWPGEKQRHAMSARGISSVLNKRLGLHPGVKPDIYANMPSNLLLPEDFFNGVIDDFESQGIDYNPRTRQHFAGNAFDNDYDAMNYIRELEAAHCTVLINPLGLDRQFESDTLIVVVDEEWAIQAMEAISINHPDEFHKVRGEKNTYRLWWD